MAREKRYLQVTGPDIDVHSEHPFKHVKNHANLLDYCVSRIKHARNEQAGLRSRFSVIDTQLAGFLALDKDDRKRELENLQGKDPKPVKMKPQFVLTQLGRGVTYLASVFSPDSGIYEALATRDEQVIANAFTSLMNNHAIKGRFFRQQCKFFLNALKYNIAGTRIEWIKNMGNLIEEIAGKTTIKETTLNEGNQIFSCDMYNTFWDPAVHPVDVPTEAEYAGEITRKTSFKIKQMIEAGVLFNMDDLWADQVQIGSDCAFFQEPPVVRFDMVDGITTSTGKTNWFNVLAPDRKMPGADTYFFELTHLYIRLLPNDFGLLPRTKRKERNKLEIWRISIVNGTRVVATEYMNNMHDYLPLVFTVPNEDDLGLQAKSIGENLYPFQEFGAFLLNTHVDATRNNIWDLIIYDPTIVDLNAVGNDVAARIAVNPSGYGKDISKSVWHFGKTLETAQTLAQVRDLLDLMEYMFPTRMLQQVADIERAVKDQVAAVMQASQRESWKLAKIIDDQSMSPGRFIMYSNIMQFQQTIEIVGPDGKKVEISPAKFRGASIEYKIGEGLKTIDKMAIRMYLRDLLNSILSAGAAADFDVPGLVNFISTIMGVESDLSAFRKTLEQRQAEAAASAPPQPPAGVQQ